MLQSLTPMGGGLQRDSYAVFETNSKMQLSTENLRKIRLRKDYCLGVLTEYEYLPTGLAIGMKQLIVDNEKLINRKNLERLLRRVGIEHRNLLSIYGFSYVMEEKFILSFYFESFAAEAGLEFAMRKESKSYFQEIELLVSIEACISALHQLQQHDIFHGNLVPQAIYMAKDGELKIADASLLDKELAMYRACVSNKAICYISPELLDMAGRNTPQSAIPQQVLHKADVFSLGMIFLYAALLEEPEDCYNWRLFSFNRESLEYRLELLHERYPGKFANLMHHMLRMDVEERPDFVELGNNLAYYHHAPARSKAKLAPSKSLLSNFHSPTFGGSNTLRLRSRTQEREPQNELKVPSSQEPAALMSLAEIDRRIQMLKEPIKEHQRPGYEHNKASTSGRMTNNHLIEPLMDFSSVQQDPSEERRRRAYEDLGKSKSPARNYSNPRVVEIIKETKEKYSSRHTRYTPRRENEQRKERTTDYTERIASNYSTSAAHEDWKRTSRIPEYGERHPQEKFSERPPIQHKYEPAMLDTKEMRENTPHRERYTTESTDRLRGRNYETQDSCSRSRRKADSIERADALIKKIKERNNNLSGTQRVSTKESYLDDRNYERKSPLRDYPPLGLPVPNQTPKYDREEQLTPKSPLLTENDFKSYQKNPVRQLTYTSQDKPSATQFSNYNSHVERGNNVSEVHNPDRENHAKLTKTPEKFSKTTPLGHSQIQYREHLIIPQNTPLKEHHTNLPQERVVTERSTSRKEDIEQLFKSNERSYSQARFERSPAIQKESNRQNSPQRSPYRSLPREKENQGPESRDYQRVDITQTEIRNPTETQRISAREETDPGLAYASTENERPVTKSNTVQKSEYMSFHVDARGYGLSDHEMKNAKIVQGYDSCRDDHAMTREQRLSELRAKYSSFEQK